MRNHPTKHINLKKNQVVVATIIILLLGAWLRLRDIGADPFGDDQERISSMALNLIHGGRWELLGPRMSTGSLKHSPFTIYLYALPFLLDKDPHIARIFTAFTNIVALAIVHVIGVRYFGRITGLLATLFLATNPAAVHSSRFIFNPNLAAPFVMLFVLFTLRGYYDGKPSSRLAHLPMLSLAGQCHPSLFLLAPVALVAWLHAWRHSTENRQHLLIYTLLSGIIALTLMAPWGIGLYEHISALEFIKPTAAASVSQWQLSTNQVFAALSGSFGVYAQDKPSLPALGYITFLASAWLFTRGVSRQDGLPGLLAVLSFFVLPTIVTVIDKQFMQSMTTTLFSAHGVERNWWIWPLMGNAALIQAAFFGGVLMLRTEHGPLRWFWNWRGLLQTRYLRGISTLAIIAASSILMHAHLQFDYRQDTGVWSLYEGRNTLDDSSDALNYARGLALRQNQELMILASDPPLQTDLCVNCRNWEALMFTKEDDVRVIWDKYGVPIPSNGAILLAPFNYSKRPLVFSGGETIFTWYRVAQLPPADHFKPDLPLLQPVHFSNGATVLGLLRNIHDSMPAPGKPWIVHILWRVDTPNPEYYKLFAHLIDINGINAQVDPPGLIPGQQHTGEHVLTQLDFQIADDLPSSGPLFIRFGMYNQNGHADIIGATVEYPDQVQVRGSDKPLSELGNGLVLDSFTMKSNLEQGPPLNIHATWITPAGGATSDTLRLNWQLQSPDNILVFDQTTNLLPKSDVDQLPGNMLITVNYALRIPTDLVPGKHRLSVTLSDSNDDSPELHFADYIDITPRRREFLLPPMQNTMRVTFADQIRLAGYDFEHKDHTLKLTLHWHALGQISVDYKYFVHVWSDSEIVAQLDAMPDSYGYPTSWWAPDEVFSDTVELDVTDAGPDDMTVNLGLYNAETGQRLPIVTANGSPSSEDWITLLPVGAK